MDQLLSYESPCFRPQLDRTVSSRQQNRQLKLVQEGATECQLAWGSGARDDFEEDVADEPHDAEFEQALPIY